jgi:hypothetical protein
MPVNVCAYDNGCIGSLMRCPIVNHIFMRNTNAPAVAVGLPLVSLDVGSSVPVVAPETLPPALDAREDSVASAPVTPDFRDGIDAFL